MFIIAIILLGASMAINQFYVNENPANLNSGNLGGNQQGTIGMVINPPSPVSGENG